MSIQDLPNAVLDELLVKLLGDVDSSRMGGQGNPMTVRDLAASLQNEDNLRDVLHFRQVSKKLNEVYTLRFQPRPGLFARLPAELMETILDQVSQRPKQMLQIDNRSSLSIESFPDNPREEVQPPDAKSPGPHQLKNLRLVSREFSNLCLERLFSRVTVRFSQEGFETLRVIANSRAIRGHVKKFTYMIPQFHVGGVEYLQRCLQKQERITAGLSQTNHHQGGPSRAESLLRGRPADDNSLSLRRSQDVEKMLTKALDKANDQMLIVNEGLDVESLELAFRMFTNLERIRILKRMDDNDRRLKRYISRDDPTQQHPSWQHACEHAIRSLLEAVLRSKSQVSQFDCRFLDVRMPTSPAYPMQLALTALFGRLTGLLLRVVDDEHNNDMNEKVAHFSRYSKSLLARTRDLIGLDVAFERVVSLPLESVLHRTSWEKLRYVGLHMWSLDSDEITGLLGRLPSLKSVRLRYVYLRTGRWRSVLVFVRRSLRLNWISLFGIGYGFGPRVPNYIENDDSDADYGFNDNEGSSSEDSSDGDHSDDSESDSESENAPLNDTTAASSDEDSDDESEHHDNDNIDNEDGHGEAQSTYSLPPNDVPSSPELPHNNEPYWEEDLDDESEIIDKDKWRRWEEWAVPKRV